MKSSLTYFTYAALACIAVYLMMVFIPRSYDVPQPSDREGTQYWHLSTGSRIAYWKLSAPTSGQPYPIIYLHGGPGGFILDQNIRLLEPVSKDGYDVYLYDQVGSGLSERLPDINDYTAERHKQDLAEIIETIGAGKVILAGQSWGAILAALYAADHPDKVDKIIITGPGPIPPVRAELEETRAPDSLMLKKPPYSNRKANQQCANTRSKAMAWWARSIGIRIASDEEADAFQTYVNTQLNKSVVCDTSHAIRAEAGGGYYVQIKTIESLPHLADPRDKLRNSPIPILVIRGQCDSQPWGFANEYLELFPNHQLHIIPDAGHSAYVEQPELFQQAIRTFLAGAPLNSDGIKGISQ